MRRILLGILVGMAIASVPVYALRVERPLEFTEWDTNTFTQLNNTLLGFWNILNGRYQMDVTTSDPDGSRRGSKGELILYDPGAGESLCVNVDGQTGWDCTSLT